MNRLKDEVSPYLLAHASNPVDWHAWGKDALNKAKSENKPIFLSIGYSACHWCHVMEHESFSNPEIADVLNEYFVSIKVDREERPDIDKIYMDALVSMNGQGGRPLSGFLTPDGHPFYMGTYFPLFPNYGLPGFKDLLLNIARSYDKYSQEINAQSREFTQKILQISMPINSIFNHENNIFTASIQIILNDFDKENGGWGTQPKFPHPLALSLLLHNDLYHEAKIQNVVNFTLESMSKGGLFDILRGGFHRYSVDEKWLVPHFEKMLYDNAQLALIYLYAGRRSNHERFLTIALKTLDFMINELLSENEGFWSSLDADSEDEEGKFYTFSKQTLHEIFNDEELKNLNQNFDLAGPGNFEGNFILRLLSNGHEIEELSKLIEVQNTRIRPKTDDKILVDWNAMAISTFAVSGFLLQNDKYLTIANRVANFILNNLICENRLYHSYRDKKLGQKGFLSDYANLINAFIDLFIVEKNKKWLDIAYSFCDNMVDLFWENNQFFDTGVDDSQLIIRPQTIDDSVTPSGWAQALLVIQKLNIFRSEEKYADFIHQSINLTGSQIQKFPISYAAWLKVISNIINSPSSIILIKGEKDQEFAQFLENYLIKNILPDVIFFSLFSNDPLFDELFILQGKSLINNKTTLYLCTRTTCSKPIFSFEELNSELNKTSYPTFLRAPIDFSTL